MEVMVAGGPNSRESEVMMEMVNKKQGGRSCAGALGAPAEKFGLGRKF